MDRIGSKPPSGKIPDEKVLKKAPEEDLEHNQGVTAKALHAAEFAQALTAYKLDRFGRLQSDQKQKSSDARSPGAIQLRPGETARVVFKDCKLAMHDSWLNTSLAPAISEGVLDLNKVSAEILDSLGPNQRQVFMHMLGSLDIEVERRDPNGLLLTGPGKNRFTKHLGRLGIEMLGKMTGTASRENAATVMARKIWASGNAEVFAKIFGAAPMYINPIVLGSATKVLTTDLLTTVFTEMLASRTAFGKPGMDADELDALGSLFAKFFMRHAGKKPQQLENSFRHLMAAFGRSDLHATPQTAGIITGAVIAGMQKALGKAYKNEKIKAAILGVSTANIWAASGLMGPFGPFIAMAVVGLDSAYQMTHLPKDNRELANRCQGAIQAHVLDHPPDGWSRDDISDWMNWVSTTILSNGS